jgi:leucyl aminopeptidase
MPPRFADPATPAIPLSLVAPADLPALLDNLGPIGAYARALGFAAKPGETIALPDAGGSIAHALVGLGTPAARARGRFQTATAARLPAGTYRLTAAPPEEAWDLALGWLLESYRFDRYHNQDAPQARLICPECLDAPLIETLAVAEALTRDLINTPAADLGPAALEEAALALAARFGARAEVTRGDDLLARNFPLIHAVGRAAAPDRAPRLVDLRWGEDGPAVTLIGKGVCFDTGGLDLKPSTSMGLMKKDMGGAATVLGLASMLMETEAPLRLRVLIPAVENSVGPDSFRPQDILRARNGLTVEVNNTDAEGRLILADALALAAEEAPDLTVTMATLTGAARVALGPDLPPFFTDDDHVAATLAESAARMRDPLWRLPFHAPYETLIEPGIADLDNAPSGGMAGAITAALFLRRFAPFPYIHLDIYGWQATAAPARPKGGVGQGARALFDAIPRLF